MISMEKKKLRLYKELLLKERRATLNTLDNMEENQFNTNLKDEVDELSVYDNHPADIGTETYQMELNFALENHEKEALRNIHDALEKIEKGNYGMCEICGKNIKEERLKVAPSAKFCLECSEERQIPKNNEEDRPIEEEVLFPPFGRTDTDYDDSVIYDGEDAWQDVEQYSTATKIGRRDEDRGAVEEVEQISNQQYKDQLPD